MASCRSSSESAKSLSFTAKAYDPSKHASLDGKRSKVVFCVRHAQGFHNKAVEETGDPEEYKNWDWKDSRLTEKGEDQAKALGERVAKEAIEPQVVLVSSLSRAIKTGLLGFPAAVKAGVPFECVDNLRETIGTHPCDKRRSRKELGEDFPSVDFSSLDTEDDERWSEVRETDDAINERARGVLGLLAGRKEERIAIVSHNDFLTAMLFNSGLKFATPEDERALRVKFGNADLHGMVLEWEEAEAVGEGK